MALSDFKTTVLAGDATATHYRTDSAGNYTTWQETSRRWIAGHWYWQIQVDRFTKIENDPVVAAMTAALEAADVACEYLVDYEQDTGYIHHIWDCQVLE